MIRPLRARHRRMLATLAVALPIGVAAALGARAPEVDPLRSALPELERATESLPVGASPADAPMARVFVRDFGPFGDLPLSALLGRDAAGRTVLEFRQRAPLLAPDLLVYWSPGRAAADVPGFRPAPEWLAGAVLLGRLGERPRQFALPAPGPDSGYPGPGYVVLHDLARGETVAVQAILELVE